MTACEFLVAVEAEDRGDQKAPLVRLASAIEPEWLFDLFPDHVREVTRVEWNRARERVEALNALMFGDIAIEQRPSAPDPQASGALLAQKALEVGLVRFADPGEWNGFLARVAFAAEHASIPRLGPADGEAALRSLACGLNSFAELDRAARDRGLLRAVEQRLPPQSRRLLEEVAPERIRLPSGRQVRVNYETDRPPWIASRLQDFFGMTETPVIARGAVPLVVHLLAPNHRPVQMTTDLAGFWRRLYPRVRRELARRYPKHAWPEDPFK